VRDRYRPHAWAGMKRWASFYRHQSVRVVEDSEMDIHVFLHVKPDPEVLALLNAVVPRLDLMELNIMAAIDDLKTAIGGFITEGTSDIATLVAQINATANQDPAIVALTQQVTDATTAMHKAFTDATGVPLPAPTPTP